MVAHWIQEIPVYPAINALLNTIQVAILVALLKWVRRNGRNH